MKRLGVNIDHVATLRNARGENHPDPVHAAKYAKKVGVNFIAYNCKIGSKEIKVDKKVKIINE